MAGKRKATTKAPATPTRSPSPEVPLTKKLRTEGGVVVTPAPVGVTDVSVRTTPVRSPTPQLTAYQAQGMATYAEVVAGIARAHRLVTDEAAPSTAGQEEPPIPALEHGTPLTASQLGDVLSVGASGVGSTAANVSHGHAIARPATPTAEVVSPPPPAPQRPTTVNSHAQYVAQLQDRGFNQPALGGVGSPVVTNNASSTAMVLLPAMELTPDPATCPRAPTPSPVPLHTTPTLSVTPLPTTVGGQPRAVPDGAGGPFASSTAEVNDLLSSTPLTPSYTVWPATPPHVVPVGEHAAASSAALLHGSGVPFTPTNVPPPAYPGGMTDRPNNTVPLYPPPPYQFWAGGQPTQPQGLLLTNTPFRPQGTAVPIVGPGAEGSSLPTLQPPPTAPTQPLPIGGVVPLPAPPQPLAGPAGQGVVPDDHPMAVRSPPVLTAQSHPELTDAVRQRVNTMLAYASPATTCYSLGQLPPYVHWGNRMHGGHDDEFLCVRNVRCKIWIIGHVQMAGFYKDGYPARRVTVQIRPLIPEDEVKALHMLKNMAHPELDDETVSGIWVSRWHAAYGIPDSQVTVFKQLYDATDGYKAKKDMRQLAATEVSPGDLVLLEVMCVRWRDLTAAEKKANPQYRKSPWARWRVEFRLDSLSLLAHDAANDGPAIDEGVVI